MNPQRQSATAPGGDLIARLEKIGEERYHNRHPFHLHRHEG
jgi:pyrroloquinoline quinone (PQQ) biosynthesis protein C